MEKRVNASTRVKDDTGLFGLGKKEMADTVSCRVVGVFLVAKDRACCVSDVNSWFFSRRILPDEEIALSRAQF